MEPALPRLPKRSPSSGSKGKGQEIDDVKATATKSGWLQKQGGKIKTWKLRYCCLHGGHLFYFVDADAAKPKGSILLAGLQVAMCDSGKPYGIKLVPTSKREREWRLAAPTEAELWSWTHALTAAITELQGSQAALPLPPQTAAYDVVQEEGGLPSYDVVDDDGDGATADYDAPAENMVYAAVEYAAPAGDKPSGQPAHRTPAPAPSAYLDCGGMADYCAPDAVDYNMSYGSGEVGTLADGFGAMELPPVPAHLQAEGQLPSPPVREAPAHVADENIYEAPNDDVFHDFAFFWPNTQREQAEVLLPRRTGAYLLRQSRPTEPVVISAYFDGDYKHYKVFSQAPKGLYLHKHHPGFMKLDLMVLHYAQTQLPGPSVISGVPVGDRRLLYPFSSESLGQRS